MPRYAFRAADAQGLLSRGYMEAPHEADVYATLRHRGLSLIDCRPKKERGFLFAKTVPLPEQVLFCRHMLALVRAGVPAHVALEDVAGMSRSRITQSALGQVHQAVMGGASLSAAFEAQGERFDALFVLLLRAGEKTGRLNQALAYLHDSLSWKDGYTTKLRRMMLYPLLQVALACMATLVLMLVAVPQIVQLLALLGQDLPWYSAALLGAVKMVGFGAAFLLLLGLAAAMLMPGLRAAREDWAVKIDAFCLRLPLMGRLISRLTLAHFAEVFSAMLGSGLGMNEALQVLPRLVRNRALRHDLEKVQHEVESGRKFTAAFEQNMHLPAYMVRILNVGEDGGELAESLRHIAELYQQESEAAMESLLKGGSLFV
ncbi:MAG TPA: type II secretion system F family protein, partial [Alphaproteobacteria bacterium]|nr:type II secretion system F family protein [Alphaproteobacteria bacterium]